MHSAIDMEANIDTSGYDKSLKPKCDTDAYDIYKYVAQNVCCERHIDGLVQDCSNSIATTILH